MRILIYGLSKSGTTILHTMVKASLENHLGTGIQEVFEPFEIFEESDGVRYAKEGISSNIKSSKNEIVKALLDSGITPQKVLSFQKYFDKKIFIVRDPRDRFVSQIFYRWHWVHRPDKEKFIRTLRLVKYKEDNPKDIPCIFLFNQNPNFYPAFSKKMLDTYDRVMKFLGRASQDWFILKYEDLIDGNVEKLEEYLSFPIRKNVSVNKNYKGVVRSKAHGNWRKWYSQEDVVFFKPIFKKYIKYLKYDSSDWKLEYPEYLPKAHGSEYMLRIFPEGKAELKAIPETLRISAENRNIGIGLRDRFSKIFRAIKLK
ncbi:sulfotransferase domain-containing protein [Microbulbifer sp. THAF38]|uniref:sulfotransferase domain-containing protein n=1 Tax=Microbulbifer sp. THAF38 TaxID=2587856 RepID=UPI001267F974|nr:sulfotransferase domain-containing protein [Microbulbifer sp. THAF38]QFT53816.1 Sulfotransferase domain protein [Microbulbifer sp. THAF38]